MSLTREDEKRLAERLARDRDPVAFRRLYLEHTQTLYSIAFRLTGNGSDAEDFVHDTWLRAVGAMGRFRGDSSLRTWLMSILINRCRESFRARRELSLEECSEPIALSDESESSVIDQLDIDRALAAMPDRYREVFVLHDIEGFTHVEISELLLIETGTSKSQLARGRRWLRSALSAGERDTR